MTRTYVPSEKTFPFRGMYRILRAGTRKREAYALLTWMPPEQFLYYAVPTASWYLPTIKTIKNRLLRGLPVDPLELWVDEDCTVVGHEGRHRAKVASILGIRLVPVRINFRGDWDSYPEEFGTRSKHKCVIIYGSDEDNISELDYYIKPQPIPESVKNIPLVKYYSKKRLEWKIKYGKYRWL